MSAMYLHNKYTTWYYCIINNATNKELISYSENHHIIPRSLGGSNNRLNLVKLTAREHFVCHWLLTKMTTGQDNIKMTHALWSMRRASGTQERYSTAITSRVYEQLKIKRSKILSEQMRGSGNHMFGKTGELAPCYGRTGEKHPLFGKKMSPESSRKKSAALTGVPKTIESNKKRSDSHKGKKHEYQLGDKNVMKRPEIAAKHKVPKPKFTCQFCGKIVGNISNIKKHEIVCKSNHKSSKYALSTDDAEYL
jgi:5-methylcytosine-specific restriction endonuclease McrA